MLGFTAHSEVPIGEFESSPHRQAPVTGVSATGAVRQLSLGADQVFLKYYFWKSQQKQQWH